MKFYTVLLTLTIFLTSFAKAQESVRKDYLVMNDGRKIYGKVTYAPGIKVSFKEENKKAAGYKPLQIKGYYHNGVYYTNKFYKERDEYLFDFSYREEDDKINFYQKTKFEVLAVGQINYYHGFVKNMGPGDVDEVAIFEIKNDPTFYLMKLQRKLSFGKSNESKAVLAEYIKDNQDLSNKLMQSPEKFNKEFVTEIITTYNEWFKSQPSSTNQN